MSAGVDLLAFLWDFDFNEAGGSSFVEVALGFNVAFVAWERFREKVQVFGMRADQIVSVATANALDGPPKNRIGKLFISLAKRSTKIHKWTLVVAYTSGWISILLALAMLYTNKFCGHDWVLLIPVVGYFVISFIVWAILSCFARAVNWLCDDTVDDEIDKLDDRLSNLEKD